MPRPRRLEVPGLPLHVIQRGNNRCPCFFGDIDRRFYLRCLAEAAARRNVAVHAYALLTNHVHLLLTPREEGAAAATLQDVGRRYVRTINTVHGRTGTLWEGRFKSSLIRDDRYLLACHRYIELNPVRAGMVSDPGDYPWSSYRHYAYGKADLLLTQHALYQALAPTDAERRRAFRALCAEDPPIETLKEIREAINAGAEIGVEIRKRGRPKKDEAPAERPGELRNLF